MTLSDATPANESTPSHKEYKFNTAPSFVLSDTIPRPVTVVVSYFMMASREPELVALAEFRTDIYHERCYTQYIFIEFSGTQIKNQRVQALLYVFTY
jgi:hypothetical protein